ncbi:MAG: hypothetical protein COA78_17250 [Blastopirellula sp.]|nr:MAG: hypothetical protein COA78_17250 [Blastopirellula sp.]
MLVLVPLQVIDETWPEVAHFIEKAIEKNGTETTIGDYFQMLRTGNAMLFVFQDGTGIHGALIADIFTGRTGETARIWAWGADKTLDWSVEFETLWVHFRKIGIKKVMCEGRPGIRALFPESRVIRLVLEMDL